MAPGNVRAEVVPMTFARMILVPALVVVGLVLPARAAAPFAVTRTDDPPPDGCAPGDCSLREAIVAANAAAGTDEVIVPIGIHTLSIPPDGSPDDGLDGDLDVNGNLVIRGQGAAASIIDAAQVDRVFQAGGADLEIMDVTIRNGSTPDPFGGGALANFGSEVTLRRVWITENRATVGDGGAINNGAASSVLTITDSALTENTVSNSGGGDGGALTNLNGATVVMTNVTISGNFANQSGGAMDNSGSSTISLTNSTVTNNTATVDAMTPGSAGGGGIASTGGTVRLTNTILAGNHDGDPTPTVDTDCQGTITSGGNNVVQDHDSTGCSFAPVTGDVTGQPAGLELLADYGGPTMTHALQPSSPAIDGGGTCGPADQRGAPRSGPCDIGAYELVLCGNVAVNRIGTSGDDTLTGTDDADGILGLGGNDSISTGAANDSVCAGGGKDTIDLGPGNDSALGEAGADRLRGLGGKDLLRGGTENDRLSGGPQKDRLLGDAGKDRLNGGPGKDRCKGGPGKDRHQKCERGKP